MKLKVRLKPFLSQIDWRKSSTPSASPGPTELSRISLESASHLQGDLRWTPKHQNSRKAVKSEINEEPQAEKYI